VRFEILNPIVIKIMVFREITIYSLVHTYQCFRGMNATKYTVYSRI
jgi:hypothetical protein